MRRAAVDYGRFLMVKNDPDAVPTRINLIFNWLEELGRLVPAAG